MRFWLTDVSGTAPVGSYTYVPGPSAPAAADATKKPGDVTPCPTKLSSYYWNAIARNVTGNADVQAAVFDFVVSTDITLAGSYPDPKDSKKMITGEQYLRTYLNYDDAAIDKVRKNPANPGKVSRAELFKHFLTSQLKWTQGAAEVLFSKDWLGNPAMDKSTDGFLTGLKEFIFTQVIRYQEEYLKDNPGSTNTEQYLYNHSEFMVVNVKPEQKDPLVKKFETDTTPLEGTKTIRDMFPQYFDKGKLKEGKLDDLLTDYYMWKKDHNQDVSKTLTDVDGDPTQDLVWALNMDQVMTDQNVSVASSSPASTGTAADEEKLFNSFIDGDKLNTKTFIRENINKWLAMLKPLLGSMSPAQIQSRMGLLFNILQNTNQLTITDQELDTFIDVFKVVLQTRIDDASSPDADKKSYLIPEAEITSLNEGFIGTASKKLQEVDSRLRFDGRLLRRTTATEKAELDKARTADKALVPIDQAYKGAIKEVPSADGKSVSLEIKDQAKLKALLSLLIAAKDDPAFKDLQTQLQGYVKNIHAVLIDKLNTLPDDAVQTVADFVNRYSDVIIDQKSATNPSDITIADQIKSIFIKDSRFKYNDADKKVLPTNSDERTVRDGFRAFYKTDAKEGEDPFTVGINDPKILAWLDNVKKLDFAMLSGDIKKYIVSVIAEMLGSKKVSLTTLFKYISKDNLLKHFGEIEVGSEKVAGTIISKKIGDYLSSPVTLKDAMDLKYSCLLGTAIKIDFASRSFGSVVDDQGKNPVTIVDPDQVILALNGNSISGDVNPATPGSFLLKVVYNGKSLNLSYVGSGTADGTGNTGGIPPKTTSAADSAPTAAIVGAGTALGSQNGISVHSYTYKKVQLFYFKYSGNVYQIVKDRIYKIGDHYYKWNGTALLVDAAVGTGTPVSLPAPIK